MSGLALLSPGTVFARDYRVARPLKEGGMGAVYVAEQLSTSRPCALKVMQPELVNHPEARKRFLREARIGAQLKSDFVVQVIQAGVDDATGMPWLAMELLEGEDLEAHVNRVGRLAPAEVLEVFDQLCDALGEAHEKGIVHRDLKPENIFLAPPRRRRDRFTVKVLDFGIARLLAEAQTTSSKTRGAMGTPLFMAPEQAQPGMAVGPFTDVWALGLIAFRLLTGNHYWRTASDPNATMLMLTMEAYVHPLVPASVRTTEVGSAAVLPPGFDVWFARCVCRSSAERIQGARQAFLALEQVLSGAAAGAQPVQAGTFGSGTEVARAGGTQAPGGPLAWGTGPAHPAASPPAQGGAFGSGTEVARAGAGAPGQLTVAAHGAGAALSGSAPVASETLGASPALGVAHTVGTTSAAPARGRTMALAAVGVGLAASLAVAGYYFLRDPGPPASDVGSASMAAPPSASAPPESSPSASAPPESVSADPEPPPSASVATSPVASAEPPAGSTPVVKAAPVAPEPGKGVPDPPKSDPPKSPEPEPSPGGRAFDKGAAAAALSAASSRAKSCKQPDGPTGTATVRVQFAPTGKVSSATVQNAPFAGTPVGNCIAAQFRSGSVPPFDGSPVTLAKGVLIQ